MTTEAQKKVNGWNFTTAVHKGRSASVVNAIARALGRMELVSEWAGADHDMPGTTQEEREMTRWAAMQFMDELEKELAEVHDPTAGQPAVETHAKGRGRSVLVAGAFPNLGNQLSAEERALYGTRPSLRRATGFRAEELAKEIYETKIWDPDESVMTDGEWLLEIMGRQNFKREDAE